MLKFSLFILAFFVALASAHSHSECMLYLSGSDKEINDVGGLKGGCYEVDPHLKIASISADTANVHFKFYAKANCKGNNVYTGATSNTVITVKEFSAGSVQLTCPRKTKH
ncbi:unnamed protein product [Umbelopsis vinacea]